jgi:hypothetical protein
MQNKGLIKFFAIIFALVSTNFLSLLFQAKIKTMLKLSLTEPEKRDI